jgi:hypothetical protein
MTASVLLAVLALVLTIISFFESRYPLLAVAVLLLCIAMLVGSAGTIHLGLVSP